MPRRGETPVCPTCGRSDYPAAESGPTLADVYALVRAVQRDVQRLQQPLTVLSVEQACESLKVSRSGLEKIDARGVFSDARPKEKRLRGRSRLYFGDEVAVYQTEGTVGVRRFRREVGRL